MNIRWWQTRKENHKSNSSWSNHQRTIVQDSNMHITILHSILSRKFSAEAHFSRPSPLTEQPPLWSSNLLLQLLWTSWIRFPKDTELWFRIISIRVFLRMLRLQKQNLYSGNGKRSHPSKFDVCNCAVCWWKLDFVLQSTVTHIEENQTKVTAYI